MENLHGRHALVRFIDEVIEETHDGEICSISGRITRISDNGRILFMDVTDSSRTVQIVVETARVKDIHSFRNATMGSYVSLMGNISVHNGAAEIHATDINILAKASLNLSPNPWHINGLIKQNRDQVLGQSDFYLANPQRMAVLKVVEALNLGLEEYFQSNRFTKVTPPILTNKVLYGKDNSIAAEVHGERIFLSQCATFELEPLALAFKKVYTISPAFRNEKGGSKRHLAEYTHAKAEILESDCEELINIASASLHHAFGFINNHAQKSLGVLGVELDPEAIHIRNQERITYIDALKYVQGKGSDTIFGKGLSVKDEHLLTAYAGNKYVWVMFNPISAEGFPYRRHDTDPRLCMTCDLIAPNGAGEMVGVAEKITDTDELVERLVDKGLGHMILMYRDYLALRKYGLPPHGGIGAAPERIVYGILGLEHVAYTKSHPRYPDHKIITQGSLNPWNDEFLDETYKKHGLLPEN